MPALPSVEMILDRVSREPPKDPSEASSRFTVGTDTPDSLLRSSWDHANRARAALTWRIDTFSIDFDPSSSDTISISLAEGYRHVSAQHAASLNNHQHLQCDS